MSEIGDLDRIMESLSSVEPEWVSAVRREALIRFRDTVLELPVDSPTTRHYTPVDNRELDSYNFMKRRRSERGRPRCETGENCLIEWDTVTQSISLDRQSTSEGVVLAPFDEETFASYGNIIKRWLFKFLDPFEDRFAMMNAGFWSGGVFIHVPDGVEVTLPIHLLRRIKVPGYAEVTRNMLIAGKGSKVRVFEDIVGLECETLRNDVFEVVAGEGADVEFLTLQDIGTKMKRVSRYRARVEKGASIRWFPVVFGSDWSICRVESTLAGAGASNETYGGFLGYGEERIDLGNNTFHLSPKTSNRIFTRGIMMGRSSSVFRGGIEIHILAKGSTSQMKQETLILSREARANSIPSLTIRTNEVQARHAASVYQIDESQIYYLMSRGVSRAEAVSLMVNGFFMPIIERITIGKFRNRIEEKIAWGVNHGKIQV